MCELHATPAATPAGAATRSRKRRIVQACTCPPALRPKTARRGPDMQAARLAVPHRPVLPVGSAVLGLVVLVAVRVRRGCVRHGAAPGRDMASLLPLAPAHQRRRLARQLTGAGHRGVALELRARARRTKGSLSLASRASGMERCRRKIIDWICLIDIRRDQPRPRYWATRPGAICNVRAPTAAGRR